MIKSDTTFSGTSSQKLTNYKSNVPRERIIFVQAGKRQRKNEANMSDTEKRLFIAGITYFNSNDNSNAIGGNFRQMVAIHRMNHRIRTTDWPSGTQRFLSWHRVYLAALDWIRFKFDLNFLFHTGIGLKTRVFQTGW